MYRLQPGGRSIINCSRHIRARSFMNTQLRLKGEQSRPPLDIDDTKTNLANVDTRELKNTLRNLWICSFQFLADNGLTMYTGLEKAGLGGMLGS